MSIWLKVVLIAAGGALGALLRTGIGEAVGYWMQRAYLGTFAVNLLGCFGMGMARAAVATMEWGSPQMRTLVFAGFLGAFTTFSTFEADAVALWQDGEGVVAACYLVGSVLGGLGMFALGWWLIGDGAG